MQGSGAVLPGEGEVGVSLFVLCRCGDAWVTLSIADFVCMTVMAVMLTCCGSLARVRGPASCAVHVDGG